MVSPFGCIDAGQEWGQQCLSDSDCSATGIASECNPTGSYSGGGMLEGSPAFKIVTEPKVNAEGYIIGTCGAGGAHIPKPILRSEMDDLEKDPFPVLMIM